MKKLLIVLLSFSAFNANAADFYVNNSGQPGTYTTIQAAIDAASTNDRIFVSPYGNYTENIAITKSLTITSAVSGTRFSVVGTVTITSALNQDVIIIGGEFSGSLTGNTGTATLAAKGLLTLSDCKFPSFTTADFIKSKVLFCEAPGTNQIRHGKIIGSQIGGITISDGPNAGVGDTLFIVGNKLGTINWNNNDNYFFIANNYMLSFASCIAVGTFQYSTVIKNLIINNTLITNSTFNYYGQCVQLSGFSNANLSNIELYNNIFQNSSNNFADIGCGSSTCNVFTGTAKLYYNFYEGSLGFVGTAVVGNAVAAGGLTLDSFGKSTDALAVDQGSPALQNYDIDLTRNNRGTFGGPYSIDNYWNTATGRARVYDLTIPFEIWNGSTPSIKAEGIHIK